MKSPVFGWRQVCGEDNDCGEFPVDGGDQAESQRRVGLENENEGKTASRGPPRRCLTVGGTHRAPRLNPATWIGWRLVEVLPSAQPCSTHAAAIEDMGEGALDHFSAPAHRLAPRYPISAAHDWRRPLCAPPRRHANAGSPWTARVRRCASSTRRLPEPSIVRANDSPCRRPRRRVPPRSAPAQPRRGCARRRPASAKASSYRLRRPDGSARPRRRRCRGRPRAPACNQMRRSVLLVAILASRSVGLFQSAFDSVLPLRFRSKPARGPRRWASRCRSGSPIRVSIAR